MAASWGSRLRSRTLRRSVLGITALVLAVVVVESGLRAYSYLTGGTVLALARQSPATDFVFVSSDPWTYDPIHGFVGKPDHRYLIGSASEGRLQGCSDLPNTVWPPADGGAGWADAQVRIAFFGVDDALVQPDWNRTPWPALLAQELSAATGRRVVVANFSRPGVGVVQSTMLAADVAPRLGADLVVLSPTTATLALDLVYRIATSFSGTAVPVVSASPRIAEEPWLGVPAGPIVSERANLAWCRRAQTTTRLGMMGLARFDTTFQTLQNQADIAKLLAVKPAIVAWRARFPSDLLALIGVAAAKLRLLAPAQPIPPTYISNPDLGADARFAAAADTMARAGIPVAVLHSPLFPELVARRLLQQYSGVTEEYLRASFGSVQRTFARPILTFFDVLPSDGSVDTKTLVNDPAGDWQLRAGGTELYSAAAAKVLSPLLSSLPINRRP